MASSSDTAGWGSSDENRHERFRCLYSRKISSSTCDSDSVPDKHNPDDATGKNPGHQKDSVSRLEGFNLTGSVSKRDMLREMTRMNDQIRSQQNDLKTLKEIVKYTYEENEKLNQMCKEIRQELSEMKGESRNTSETRMSVASTTVRQRRINFALKRLCSKSIPESSPERVALQRQWKSETQLNAMSSTDDDL